MGERRRGALLGGGRRRTRGEQSHGPLLLQLPTQTLVLSAHGVKLEENERREEGRERFSVLNPPVTWKQSDETREGSLKKVLMKDYEKPLDL